MKKIIYLFLLTGYFGYSQDYKFENDELKGNVQFLELLVSDKYNTDRLIEYKTFDKKGRILISKRYDGKYIRENESNQYFENQIITEFCDSCKDLDKVFADFSDKGSQKSPYKGYATADPSRTYKIIRTTDNKGNVILSKTYSSEGYFLWETKFIYDKKSNLLLEETFDDEGKKRKEYKKNTYNKKGLLTEKISKNNYTENKYIYEYDNLDRKIFEKQFYGERITEITFKYDNLGRTVYEKHSSNLEVVYEYTTIKDTVKVVKFHVDSERNKQIRNVKILYSKGKNKITEERQFDEKGETSSTRIVEKDENQNLISSKFSNSVGYAVNKDIIYDKKGNWIEQKISKLVKASYDGSEPKPEWQTEKYIRKIQYY
ncbi:MAG: hypothetical protein DCF13_02480 [Flavobacteriaceae bacterium]|nr:MAG: hypothetical protein DCF13_02480 [Flavobacteriaceae bacterium]